MIYKLLILILGVACIIQTCRLYTPQTSDVSILHDLAHGLITEGLNCRLVADRKDGLLIATVYLTQSDLDDQEIRSLPIRSDRLSRWRGTVRIICDPSSTTYRSPGDHRYGPFLIFGDEELVQKIGEILASGVHEDLPYEASRVYPFSYGEWENN
jgi:hypothetical protein